MGREHLINLYHLKNEGVAVVCIADPHLPSQNLAESFDWPLQVFTGHKQLLESGLCDVVVVSTPIMTHYENLMDIINHPKPHQCFGGEAFVIDAAKTRSDMLVQVGLEYRYMPPVAKLIDIVKEGALGQVKMVSIREHRFPFLVKVNNLNRFNCNTGGTLVEKCCHFFDLLRLFIGANPVRVMASGAMDVNHKDEVYDGRVPYIIDNAYVIVEFDNGCRDMLDLCMFAEGSKNEQDISVVGDIGKSIVRWGTRAEGRNGVQTLLAKDKRIKGKQAPAVGLHDGLVSVAIGVAAQLSIKKGRSVMIVEVMHEQLTQSIKS
ncbi:unnamed protein product [Withania somnifera]